MFTLLAGVVGMSVPATQMWAKITYLFCSDITVTILPFRATPFPRSSLLHKVLYSLVPRLPWNANVCRGESLVSLLREHDVIKIGPEQKGNFCALFNQLCVQPLMCMIFNPQQLDKLPIGFALFPVLSLQVHPCTTKVSLPPLYLNLAFFT